MKKSLILAFTLIALTILMMRPSAAFAANPPSNQYEMIIDVSTGAGPVTLDPANCYDTASAEVLFNTYDPLIFFDGERTDVFLPRLATQVWIGPPAPGSPDYTYESVYFKIRVGAPFHTVCRTDDGATSWAQYYLTTTDVEYSFERWMVHDYVGGPTWLILEPLLDCFVSDPLDPNFGTYIDHSVESNSTYVWMNLANKNLAPVTSPVTGYVKMFSTEDGDFSPTFWADIATLPLNYPMRVFTQVISQSWASIISKPWIINFVKPLQDDWDGDFSDWTDYHGWSASPLDKIPGTAAHPGVAGGTGPYILDRYNPSSGGEWSMVKYDDYWGGWPSPDPSPPYSPVASSLIKPAGYVTRVTERQRSTALNWQELAAGSCDLATISRTLAGNLHAGGNRNAETLDGIRLVYPISGLTVNSMHFTFDVEPTGLNTYGKVNDGYGSAYLSADGIPRDFFGDVHVRRAFAYLVNFTVGIADQMLGEAYQPITCAVNGLPYVNLAQATYGPQPDFTAAKNEFDQAFGGNLVGTGFTVHICYNTVNALRQAMMENLAAMVNYIGNTYYGGKFTCIAQGESWDLYIPAMDAHELPMFCIGWLADYFDIQNFMFPYMHSSGTFALSQRYSNPTCDSLLDNAIRTADGPARQAIYYQLESIYYNDVPSIGFLVANGRGYMQSWVEGRYYNPLYPGFYAYDEWKWEYKRGNVDYNNKIDLSDLTAILDSFGSYAGKQGMPVFHARWNFNCDVDGNPKDSSPAGHGGWRDRKIDLYDISAALDNFGKTDVQWTGPP